MSPKTATATVRHLTNSRASGGPVPCRAVGPTARQRSVRGRLTRSRLESAVRRAVDVFFHFTHRDPRAKVLWCHTEQVWMGSETYLNWALCDSQIDIPWVVAATADAPEDASELREVVRIELKAYWKDRIASLSSRTRPCWQALP